MNRPLLSLLGATLALSPAARALEAKGLLRVNTTIQTYSAAQPWELNQPRKRRGLGAMLAGGRVLTTAEMAADAPAEATAPVSID